MPNAEYIQRLELVISLRHDCRPIHLRSAFVCKALKDRTVCYGYVEIFRLIGYPKAHRCYAWAECEDKDDTGERVVVVLQSPTVVSPETAVHAQILEDMKSARATKAA